ncbi:2,3-diaminopropionate biosynthesis protein SbnA [Streptomyces fuscichromogenes]|uniref:Tryptophan synthase beta chain-like PALP domain-containing protein n=1 Tax=Streptomyces fuscichromogenes TaxID=1324013 RepID=A0A918CQ81_9ACTN|nr:2,3-diaminopropionate biosynthesis protein SbnA [Streptomyces fuscichromogenes]GGN01340.1 hypothetical protein GCM10011578_023370 [Streptomyces fuscichromogenes]
MRNPTVPDPGEDFVPLTGLLPHAELWLKLESRNPAGSIKMKTATAMIDAAERSGLLRPGAELIESTSGNLGVAMAAICAARGYHLTLVTDPNSNYRSVQQMRALGAEVVVVERRDDNGGYLGSRIAYISLRLATEPGLVWLNQYANPANVAAHRDGTAVEICERFGVPDWLFVGVGTSGTLMGCVEHFAGLGTRPTVVAVDVLGSITFGGAPARRLIPGMGASRKPEIFAPGEYRRVLVSERDTIVACRRIASRYGLLVGGSTGTVVAAAMAHRHRLPPGSRVLAISPDLGGAYLDTIYDDGWVATHFGDELLRDSARSARRPVREELVKART